MSAEQGGVFAEFATLGPNPSDFMLCKNTVIQTKALPIGSDVPCRAVPDPRISVPKKPCRAVPRKKTGRIFDPKLPDPKWLQI